jgi:hypothetical protein
VERAEPQLESSVTGSKSKPDPDQIVDEKGLFQDQPQRNLSFPPSLPQKLLLLQSKFWHQPADLLRMPTEESFVIIGIQVAHRTEKKRILCIKNKEFFTGTDTHTGTALVFE